MQDQPTAELQWLTAERVEEAHWMADQALKLEA
jgi:hypothetical protein